MNDVLVNKCAANRPFYCKNCAINIIVREPSGKWRLSVLGDDDYGQFQEDSDDDKPRMSMDIASLVLGIALGSALTFAALRWRIRKKP